MNGSVSSRRAASEEPARYRITEMIRIQFTESQSSSEMNPWLKWKWFSARLKCVAPGLLSFTKTKTITNIFLSWNEITLITFIWFLLFGECFRVCLVSGFQLFLTLFTNWRRRWAVPADVEPYEPTGRASALDSRRNRWSPSWTTWWRSEHLMVRFSHSGFLSWFLVNLWKFYIGDGVFLPSLLSRHF